ncbi:MAG: hypothetical protein U0670_14990 [Anaerolineae bacterium]
MPLDDAYIHFQYAHQIAQGQIYVYNPGLPPTSGATSFLYPYLLAIGDLIGFRGLSLGFWAMGLGALSFTVSVGLVWGIGRRLAGEAVALVMALVFLVGGAAAWHFMSGMETGIAVLFTLLTLYGLIVRRDPIALMGASLIALIRPEGAILTVLTVGYLGIHWIRQPSTTPRRNLIGLAIPLALILVQPVVNLIVTGSAVATGNSAKSLLGVVPFDFGYVLSRILENVSRMTREWLSLSGTEIPFYVGLPVSLLAMVGMGSLVLKRQKRGLGILIILWLIGSAAAVATLDTAFWHFRRYQIPIMAVLIVLAVIGAGAFPRRIRWAAWMMAVAALIIAPLTGLWFLQSYIVNVGYVFTQPYQMAQWLRENAPDNSVIAVHDVGMMRYQGEHTTLDIVGLTTPGAADYWRNGPGSVGEFLIRQRPDLIASYGEGHGLGLGLLQHTSLYAETLASYSVSLDNTRNVALAADTQGIYQPDYAPADRRDSLSVLPSIYPDELGALVDSLNVADIQSEREHAYAWTVNGAAGGFPTDFYQLNTISCGAPACTIMDGGRRLNGDETFTLRAVPNADAILVTRLHPVNTGTFDVYANGQNVGTRVIPPLPGAWIEVPTLIPAALISSEVLHIRIVPHVPGGAYMPYYHWLFAAAAPAAPGGALTNLQDGAIQLLETSSVRIEGGQLEGTLDWYTPTGTSGDWSVFVHVYAEDDLNTVLAQTDSRPGRGMLPPGNWLPGVIRDTIRIDVSGLAPGRYRVALGLYDPVTFARLTPTDGDDQNRFWFASFENP